MFGGNKMKTPIWKRLLCMFLSAAMLVTLAACGTESSVGASAPDSATVAKVDEASDEATTTTDAVSVAELPAGATEDLKSKWSSLSGKTLRVATSGQQAAGAKTTATAVWKAWISTSWITSVIIMVST